MRQLDTLASSFLIASPSLVDPNFRRTVVVMCMHSDQGAMGLIINRPAPVSLGDLIEQMGISYERNDSPSVLVGGPVAVDSGILLYEPSGNMCAQDNELAVGEDLRICPNQGLLEEIAEGRGPEKFHVFIGHAGWGPGQLEREVALGCWIPGQLNSEIVFNTPAGDIWEQAMFAEGVNPIMLATARPQA